MRTRKFGEVDPATGRKWGGSPLTHWRALRRALEAGVVDVPCGECSACCRSGVPIYEDDGAEVPKRADGACVHLDEAGWCDRHDSRPEHCRLFTCTLMSIAGVVTDNEAMNRALANWEWDLRTPEDRAFQERAMRNEAEKTRRENLPAPSGEPKR